MGIVDNGQPRRGRTKYTNEQLYALERSFCLSQYPDTATMENLADMCSVSVDKISTWFQNRRSKFKRQSKDTNISWMRKHIFNKDQPTGNKPTGGHVLSPPSADNFTSVPRSNLNYMPVGYFPASTPYYPPMVPYDMFSDILRDVDSTQTASENTLPNQQARNSQWNESSSNFTSPLPDSPLESSSPKTPITPTYALDNNASPASLSDQSFIGTSSPESFSSSVQTTPPPPCRHLTSMHSQHNLQQADIHSYYFNQAFSWHYFNSTVHRR